MFASDGGPLPPHTLVVYTDGASRGNPGPAGFGVVITNPQDLVLYEFGHAIGRATNNEAEYHALIAGLESALKMGAKRVELFLDSELVVLQILGHYKVKSPSLTHLFRQAQSLLKQFESYSISHVRRHLNKRADELANRAIDAVI